jgi:cytochrome c-type biogenesis protein CcmH/NrfG
MATRVDRSFVRRSLEDLEREHDAGDLSDRDYLALRERYERRLRDESPPRPPARRGHVVAAVGFLVVFAVVAGVLVARSAGRREDGGGAAAAAPTTAVPASGPTTTLPGDLARCLTLEGSEAIGCYTTYTEANPDDPAGFTQFAIFAIQAGMQTSAGGRTELFAAGESFLQRALDLDPAAVDARVYLAVLLDRTERVEEAAAECARLADVDVPADLRPLVALACAGGATTGP